MFWRQSPDVYTSVLRLTEAEYFNSEISADLMFSSENRNVLKKLIMEKGAFSIAYNAVDDEKSFLNTTTGAYFYPLDAKSNANTDTPADKINHLIAIIGWDDNFAVENFNSVARPSKPGAWLARNSWNTNWPSDELGGYFWISYEQILYHGTAFVIEPANKNLRTYYHDDLGWCSSWGDDDTTGKAASVFQSKGNETIKEIGFYTTENGANVTVSIYKYDENPAVGRVIYDIQDGGALESEQTEYYDLAGYHTMKLDNPVNISENEYFAAVLTAVNPSYKYPLAIESRLNGYSDYAMIFDGENYFYSSDDDVWVNGASLTQVSNDVTIAVPANVCIKVFAECSDDVTVEYESPVGKSINGIEIGTPSGEPTYSEEAFNELNEESVTEGREFSQILVDNDGNILSEDLTVGLTLIYVEEFEEETPGEVSQYGLKDIPQEIDPLYPAGFEPDAYMYLSQEDGFIYPTYSCYAVTDKDGSITINADSMKSLNPIKNEKQLPTGHYLGYYVAFTSPDLKPSEIIGMLKPFEITEAEEDEEQQQNNNNFSRSSSGSCNLGIAYGLIALLSMAIILKRK